MKQFVIFILLLNFYSCHPNRNRKTADQVKSDSLTRRSEYYLTAGKLDSAQYFVDQALIWDSLNYAAYDDRAILKWKQKKPQEEVISDLKNSLRINQGNKPALFSLVNYYYEIGDYERAEEAGDHYVFQYGRGYLDDSTNLNEIKRIITKSQMNRKFNILISTTKARAFYDSVNTILKKSDSVQQRFVNNISFEMMRFLNGKSKTGVDYLKKSFDSAVAANEISIKKISLITEVDSVTNYKHEALKRCLVFKNVYRDKLEGFIYCLKSKDFIFIKNCVASTRPSIFELKKAETVLTKSGKEFRKKHQF